VNKIYKQISELSNWEENPRGITEGGFKRLKKQISKLGQYKPLLITTNGTVIGGNMRLRAYQELKISKVWVSIIIFKQEGDVFFAYIDGEKQKGKYKSKERGMIEYALSDNDRAGSYNADDLINLLDSYDSNMEDFSDYSIDFKESSNINDFVNSKYSNPFNKNKEINSGDISKASENQVSSVMPKAKKHTIEVACPHCGESFEIKA